LPSVANGTGIAALSPTLFGALIATHSRTNVNYGYLLGAGLMIAAGVVAIFLAVDAEGRSLEDVARPFTAARDLGRTQAQGDRGARSLSVLAWSGRADRLIWGCDPGRRGCSGGC
jgi:hypothetical protein